ncbi:M23 family metallopeptidase [Patescibacteria group bacterium]|nr:M23 family metallopeptidase [Patescibacteria group bacterium]
MLHIDIEVRRPVALLFILGGTVGLFVGLQSVLDERGGLAVGGYEASVMDAEQEVYRQRTVQAVLGQREEILRYQLRLLDQERDDRSSDWSTDQMQEWNSARTTLLSLLEDRRASEEIMRSALEEIWEAEARALALSGDGSAPLRLTWPVEPLEGISAGFHDQSYLRQFGISHEAIDIPVEQGSPVLAASDGVVEVIYEGESGYNYVILKHSGGATLYGHVSAFQAEEGQYVHRGDSIALSGGRPGTSGAGPISTGPHLHFEVIRGGVHRDPTIFLPAY